MDSGELFYCPHVTSCLEAGLSPDPDTMRRLFAVLISALLIFGFAPMANADVAGLTPCAESPRFQQRASAATTAQAKARFERYSQAVCGADGLPHLIVDGRWSHAGDFFIPGIAFLYIAGTIGWAGRGYLQAIRGSKDATTREIQIDVPLAFKSTLAAATWPLAAFGEFTSGKLVEADSKVTVSPR
jgi:photosystem I subunit 3